MALCSIGPRQMTGWSSGTKKPIDRHLHPVGRGGDHQVAEDHRIVVGAEHLGDGEPVDVGVEDAHPVAGLGQRHGQVHRHRRLPHAALPRGHPDDPGGRSGWRKRASRHAWASPWPVAWPCAWSSPSSARAGHAEHVGAQTDPQGGPLVVGHDLEIDRDLLDAGLGQRGLAHPSASSSDSARRPPGGRARPRPAGGGPDLAARTDARPVAGRARGLDDRVRAPPSCCDLIDSMHSLVFGWCAGPSRAPRRAVGSPTCPLPQLTGPIPR